MRLIVMLLLLLGAPVMTQACGKDSDCRVGDRTYRLYVPEGAGSPMGAIVFAHGYRGSAAGEMRNAALRKVADDLGMALIALKSAGDDWQLAHTPRAPERAEALEYGYVDAVLADAATRVDLDGSRLVMSGFSAGGMMTWTLACGMSDRFRGFVPMSGTFWKAAPDGCPTPPANLVHIHGTEDRTVPLTGRVIGPVRQGDVQGALAMYAGHGGFARPRQKGAVARMDCVESANPAGKVLAFCSFPGGHDFNTQRLRYGVERVLAAP